MAGRKLTALKLKTLTKPGRYGDGGGLWLQVRGPQHRSWLFRYTASAKQRQMGLGPFPDVPLAEAREAAQRCRAAVRQGQDPIDLRRRAKLAARDAPRSPTFRAAAESYMTAHEAAWRNPRHRAQWRSSLTADVFPVIGDLPVSAIETANVIKTLEPIWHQKPETSSRLRARIEAVLDYAATMRWRAGENPARWKNHLSNIFESRRRLARALHGAAIVEHHSALPWPEIGVFVAELRRQRGVAPCALEFTILTAARTGETLGALWSEIDFGSATWAIPAARTKGGRAHRVPLSAVALGVLETMAKMRAGPDGYIFPGGKIGKPLAGTAMRKTLRRMKRPDLTVHGFRSTFRDWAAEATNHPREVAEQALAHAVGDKVEAAYRRGDLFEKRRRLMEDWAAFCDRPTAAGEVVPIRRMG
jgi:integrase